MNGTNGVVLTAGWNLLLVPALLRLHRSVVTGNEALAPIVSVAGLLSLSFWAFGGLTTNTGPLETVSCGQRRPT